MFQKGVTENFARYLWSAISPSPFASFIRFMPISAFPSAPLALRRNRCILKIKQSSQFMLALNSEPLKFCSQDTLGALEKAFHFACNSFTSFVIYIFYLFAPIIHFVSVSLFLPVTPCFSRANKRWENSPEGGISLSATRSNLPRPRICMTSYADARWIIATEFSLPLLPSRDFTSLSRARLDSGLERKISGRD